MAQPEGGYAHLVLCWVLDLLPPSIGPPWLHQVTTSFRNLGQLAVKHAYSCNLERRRWWKRDLRTAGSNWTDEWSPVWDSTFLVLSNIPVPLCIVRNQSHDGCAKSVVLRTKWQQKDSPISGVIASWAPVKIICEDCFYCQHDDSSLRDTDDDDCWRWRRKSEKWERPYKTRSCNQTQWFLAHNFRSFPKAVVKWKQDETRERMSKSRWLTSSLQKNISEW